MLESGNRIEDWCLNPGTVNHVFDFEFDLEPGPMFAVPAPPLKRGRGRPKKILKLDPNAVFKPKDSKDSKKPCLDEQEKKLGREQRRRQKEQEFQAKKRQRTEEKLDKLKEKHQLTDEEVKSLKESLLRENESLKQSLLSSSLFDLNLFRRDGYQLPLKPLPVPFDAISFDGLFGITVLSMACLRDVQIKGVGKTPVLCRFNFCPEEYKMDLMGPEGIKHPSNSYIFPSLASAVSRANHMKSADGWNFFYVLVVHDGGTERVALQKFQPKHGGPGFVIRKNGPNYTKEHLHLMCRLAHKTHLSNMSMKKQNLMKSLKSLGIHRDKDVFPAQFQPLIQVLPNRIYKNPVAASVECKDKMEHIEYVLPRVTESCHPTFIHYCLNSVSTSETVQNKVVAEKDQTQVPLKT